MLFLPPRQMPPHRVSRPPHHLILARTISIWSKYHLGGGQCLAPVPGVQESAGVLLAHVRPPSESDSILYTPATRDPFLVAKCNRVVPYGAILGVKRVQHHGTSSPPCSLCLLHVSDSSLLCFLGQCHSLVQPFTSCSNFH